MRVNKMTCGSRLRPLTYHFGLVFSIMALLNYSLIKMFLDKVLYTIRFSIVRVLKSN